MRVAADASAAIVAGVPIARTKNGAQRRSRSDAAAARDRDQPTFFDAARPYAGPRRCAFRQEPVCGKLAQRVASASHLHRDGTAARRRDDRPHRRASGTARWRLAHARGTRRSRRSAGSCTDVRGDADRLYDALAQQSHAGGCGYRCRNRIPGKCAGTAQRRSWVWAASLSNT